MTAPSFVAGVAVDEQLAAAHPTPAPRIGGTGMIPDRAVDTDQSAAHFGSDPVIDVAMDFDRPAGHPGPEMGAGIAPDDEPAAAIVVPSHLTRPQSPSTDDIKRRPHRR